VSPLPTLLHLSLPYTGSARRARGQRWRTRCEFDRNCFSTLP
jgi:hypothetical protein